MPDQDLIRILGKEKPVKSLIIGLDTGEQLVKFWNPSDSPEGIYIELQDILGEIAALDSEINREGLKKQAEIEAKQAEFEAEATAIEESKSKTKTRKTDDRVKLALVAADISDEVEKFKADRRNKQRTKRTPLYRRYIELIARQEDGAFASLRPSQIHALYNTLKPIVDRVLDDPDNFEPEDEPEVEQGNASTVVASNGQLTTTETTLHPISAV